MKKILKFISKRYQQFLIYQSGLFDLQYYLDKYPDVKESGMNPVRHYLEYGGFEGRDPSIYFESAFYLNTYPDVKEAGMNPLLHYIRFGRRERRTPVDLGGVSIKPIHKWRYYSNEFLNVFSNHKVSVIVPSYNASHTIVVCLKSLIQQTYTNIEIIVVDDGSEDGTGKLVQKINRLDLRVKYVRLPENKGTYAALNTGIRCVRGKYIGMQGADDISLSTRIEKQIQAIRKYKVLFALSLFTRSQLKMDALDGDDQMIMQRVQTVADSNSKSRFQPHICLGSLIIHKKVFKKYGLYWENRYASDTELLERVLYHELNLEFPNTFNHITAFFYKLRFHHRLFIILDEVLYLSSVQNSNNLTIKYPIRGKERNNFAEEWRRRFRNEVEYEYPRL